MRFVDELISTSHGPVTLRCRKGELPARRFNFRGDFEQKSDQDLPVIMRFRAVFSGVFWLRLVG